jgi:hypothetical protein
VLPPAGSMDGMAASSTPEDVGAPAVARTATDPTVDEVLRDAGFQVTAAGKAHWRQRLATPIPAEALAEGKRMLDEARGHAA